MVREPPYAWSGEGPPEEETLGKWKVVKGIWLFAEIWLCSVRPMLYACHRGGIPSLTELHNFVCAYYSYRNALTLTCWLKACVLYFPPASLDLDFRLQIRKDS